MTYTTESLEPQFQGVPMNRELVARDIEILASAGANGRQEWMVHDGGVSTVGRITLQLYTEDTVRAHWRENSWFSAGIVGMAQPDTQSEMRVFLVMQHDHRQDQMSVRVQFTPYLYFQYQDLASLVSKPVYKEIILATWRHIERFQEWSIQKPNGESRLVSTYAADALPPATLVPDKSAARPPTTAAATHCAPAASKLQSVRSGPNKVRHRIGEPGVQ